MPRSLPAISADLLLLAQNLGERIALARGRRKLSKTIFAQRLDVSRNTLDRLEAGDPSVALGTYLKALRVLGLQNSLDLVALEDPLGHQLQDHHTLQTMQGTASRATTFLKNYAMQSNQGLAGKGGMGGKEARPFEGGGLKTLRPTPKNGQAKSPSHNANVPPEGNNGKADMDGKGADTFSSLLHKYIPKREK